MLGYLLSTHECRSLAEKEKHGTLSRFSGGPRLQTRLRSRSQGAWRCPKGGPGFATMRRVHIVGVDHRRFLLRCCVRFPHAPRVSANYVAPMPALNARFLNFFGPRKEVPFVPTTPLSTGGTRGDQTDKAGRPRITGRGGAVGQLTGKRCGSPRGLVGGERRVRWTAPFHERYRVGKRPDCCSLDSQAIGRTAHSDSTQA